MVRREEAAAGDDPPHLFPAYQSTELRAPLRRWAERFYGGLLSLLQRLRTAVELDRLEIEERLIAPVEQLAIALDSLS